MAPTTPYSHVLGDRDPVATMRETAERVRTLTAPWTPRLFERSLAAGKWSARLILIHLAQYELASGTRARLALSTLNYQAQPFDQYKWIRRDSTLTGEQARDAFAALCRMNAAFYEALSDEDRSTPLSHPEFGALTVDWILHQQAGHQLHHLRQLEQIAALPGD